MVPACETTHTEFHHDTRKGTPFPKSPIGAALTGVFAKRRTWRNT